MAKKRTVQKKASDSGKSQHDSEILRAKRAVSAALNTEPTVTGSAIAGASAKASTSGGITAVMKGLVRAAADIVGQGGKSAGEEQPPAVDSVSTATANPLAELARQHIIQSSKSLSRSTESEKLCRKILANLARARLDSIEQNPSQTTRT